MSARPSRFVSRAATIAVALTLFAVTLLVGWPLAVAHQQAGDGGQPKGDEVKWEPGPDAARYLTYIHTDKPIYRGGESVYVRGMVLHHASRQPYQSGQPNQPNVTGLLTITGPKGDTIHTAQVQLQDGSWGSKWDVPAEIAGGEFKLEVSYPQHGLPPAEREFDVREYRAPRLKSQIKFVRDGYGPGDEVAATLEVERAEGDVPAGAAVDVTVRVDGSQVHEAKAMVQPDGRCHVKFTLPEELKRGEGTLSFGIHDGGVVENAAKTIPILLQTVDIQLYPEGGDLVAGLPSRIYFEAFTPAGKPADLAGKVVDNDGDVVAEFRSEHEGRGRFELTAEQGKQYHLEFTEPAGITQHVALPKAKPHGIALSTRQNIIGAGKDIGLRVASTLDEEIRLIARQRERIVAQKSVSLKAGKSQQVKLSLGDQPLAEGVLIVTAYDGKGQPRAERLVFRQPRETVQVKITPESGTGFVPGGTVKLKIETTRQGKPVSALVGVTVTDDSVLEMIDRREQTANLPVAVLLESEVRELADAHVYFDADNPIAPTAVDLLLGVQGWRRFALVDPAKWLAEYPDAGRRVLAQAIPLPMAMNGLGGGFGGGGGAMFGVPRRGAVFQNAPVADVAPPAPAGAEDAEEDAPAAEAGDGAQVDKDLRRANVNPVDRFAENEKLRDFADAKAKGEAKDLPMREQLAKQPAALENREEAAAAAKPANRPVPGADRQAFRRIVNGRAGGKALGGEFEFADELQQLQQMSVAQPIVVREYRHQVRSNRKAGERIDFAETVYWNAGTKTNADGVAYVNFDLSDAVTTFRVKVDAVSNDGALGAGTAGVESVEPFYLEPKLPLEVTMGDLIQTPLGIVNSTSAEMAEVNVGVDTGKLGGVAEIAPFAVGPQGRLRKRLNVRVGEFVGDASLRLTAVAGDYRDEVTRTVRVAPLGFPHESGGGAMLLPGGVVAFQLTIPRDVVPGSAGGTASVFPTPLATMTSALEALIREPYGCFEQTSSTTYPLVMAQQYFKSHQGVDPKLIERSAAMLDKGYQRLIGFESPSGGFEWFGGDPGHDALTAYGLLEFTDMSKVQPVDSAMLSRTRQWLMTQRDGKGGYERKTHTLHTWLADPEVAFSYNTWALLEAGTPPEQLAREVEWVADVAERTENTYVIALGANVAQLGGKTEAAQRLLDKLTGLQAKDGSLTGATVSVVGSGGEALKIEATSLALLAWLRDHHHVNEVERGIKYLAEVCKGGRFGSTQSTVLALRGIVEYDLARTVPRVPGAISLWVNGKPVGEPIAFDQNSHGAIQLPDFAQLLTPGKHQVELRMKDGSEMPCTLTYRYHSLKPASSPNCVLDLEVKLADQVIREGATTDVEVVVVNRSEKEVPTPTAIVGLPGGLEVRHDKLKECVDEGLIAAYEVRGREVILYWRVLDPEQRVRVPLNVVAAVPGEYTGPASRAYLYYTDEHKTWVGGLQATVTPAK
ncbi:MAG: hypothetical protein KDB14_01470 [Planctomycetales bacterium]|nr:hypothetical protein [Planctomycetales bacterium]